MPFAAVVLVIGTCLPCGAGSVLSKDYWSDLCDQHEMLCYCPVGYVSVSVSYKPSLSPGSGLELVN